MKKAKAKPKAPKRAAAPPSPPTPAPAAPDPASTLYKSKGGRPLKLTQAVGDTIVRQLELGAFRTDACEAAGVTAKTLERWEKRAQNGEQPFEEFFADVYRAEATSKIRLHAMIYARARGLQFADLPDGSRVDVSSADWKAGAWLLEKKPLGTYAPVQRLQHQSLGADGTPRDPTPIDAAQAVRQVFGAHAMPREVEAKPTKH